MNNYLTQRLEKKGEVFQVISRVLCPVHHSKLPGEAWINATPADGECEACLEERRTLEAAYESGVLPLMAKLTMACARRSLNPWEYVVYVSGPMTSVEEFNRPAFHRMERVLTRHGFKYLSPAHYDDNHTYEWYMEQGIAMVIKCQGVVLLRGWSNSLGASLERAVADVIGRDIFYEEGNREDSNHGHA